MRDAFGVQVRVTWFTHYAAGVQHVSLGQRAQECVVPEQCKYQPEAQARERLERVSIVLPCLRFGLVNPWIRLSQLIGSLGGRR